MRDDGQPNGRMRSGAAAESEMAHDETGDGPGAPSSFYAAVALLGLPRSGTTLTHRLLAAHSAIDGIVEPYHGRRKRGYETTDPETLAADSRIAPSPDRVLLVKETTTRRVNVALTLDFLRNARNAGIPTVLVVLLRSPFECFLSQVEASRERWAEGKMTEASEASFRQFMGTSVAGLGAVAREARAHTVRTIAYPRLCEEPDNEIARLLAAIPLALERRQLRLIDTGPRQQGGDPKAYEKQTIELSNRSAEVAALKEELALTRPFRTALKLEAITEGAHGQTDSDVMDALAGLTISRQA